MNCSVYGRWHMLTFAASLALLCVPLSVRSQPIDKVDEGVEVQTRGPIHEAFAQPLFRRQGGSPIIQKTPPQPIDELPPEQRPEGNDVEWIPGYWGWDEERDGFLWVSGVWRDSPPNHDWVPGYWLQVEGGWQWVSGYWTPTTTAQVQLYPAPPDPVEEAQAPAPNDESVYIPGCWVYRDARYWWRPGFWVANRPGWVWASASYYWTPSGYMFVDGYWDMDLEHRGMCFAPVYIDQRVYGRPGWQYRPSYAVLPDVLLASLFVQTRWNHYAFGDYYDAGYANRGYVPWMNFRIGNRFANPMLGYYSWRNRNEPRWEDNLRSNFVARQQNPQARPPRTFALQQKGNVNVLTSINQFTNVKNAPFRLQPVAKIQIDQAQQQVTRIRQASQQRQKAELHHAKQPATQNPVKIEVPIRTGQTKKLTGDKSPPPLPTHPTVTQQSPMNPNGKPPVTPDPPNTKPTPPNTKPTPPNTKPTPPVQKPTPPTPPNVKPMPPDPPGTKPAPPTFKPTPPMPPTVKPTPPMPPAAKPTPPMPPQAKPTPPMPPPNKPAPPAVQVPPPMPPPAKPAPPMPPPNKPAPPAVQVPPPMPPPAKPASPMPPPNKPAPPAVQVPPPMPPAAKPAPPMPPPNRPMPPPMPPAAKPAPPPPPPKAPTQPSPKPEEKKKGG